MFREKKITDDYHTQDRTGHVTQFRLWNRRSNNRTHTAKMSIIPTSQTTYMVRRNIITPEAVCEERRIKKDSWLHSASWLIRVFKRTICLCEWHSTEWPRIREQKAILKICHHHHHHHSYRSHATKTSFISSTLRTLMLVTLSYHLIFKIHRRCLIMKTCSFFTCLPYSVHVSAPYSKVDSMIAR